MTSYAHEKGLKKGDYKRLNLPFESKIMAQTAEVRERMIKRIEDFAYNLLIDVFNAKDSADIAIQTIIEKNSHDMGPKYQKTQNPKDWTPEKIKEKASLIDSDKGPDGDFDD